MEKYEFTEEQLMIKELAKKFSDEKVAPVAAELDANHEFPMDLIKQCGELMFLGACIPEEYGGAGLDTSCQLIIMEELARHSSSVASTIDTHMSLGAMPILKEGTPEQKEKFLKPAATGEKLCAFALTEPQSGSDAGGTKCAAVLDGDEWVINGNKTFISNLGVADIYLVACKTDPTAKGSKGISLIIVEAGTPGFTLGKPVKKMSNRSARTGDLYFDNCRVPKGNLVGELNHGFPLVLSCCDEGRLAIAAIGVGTAQGALERATKWAKERVAFGHPICEYQGISFKLADMAMQIELARTMLYYTARLDDAGLPFAKEAAMVKLFSSEMAVKVCEEAIEIMGGYGLCEEYDVERLYRDAKLLTIGEGTSEILRMVISRYVLKEY